MADFLFLLIASILSDKGGWTLGSGSDGWQDTAVVQVGSRTDGRPAAPGMQAGWSKGGLEHLVVEGDQLKYDGKERESCSCLPVTSRL